MTSPILDPDEWASLLDSWEIDLKAARKSANTITQYQRSARQYLAWCAEVDRPQVVDRRGVNGWLAHLVESGAEGATVRSRQLGVRRFAAWLVEEGELDTDPLLGMKAPPVDIKVVEPLSDDEVRALLAACTGRDFRSRRDEAIVRFLAETGARAGELVAMEVADIDARAGLAVIRRGKGGKGRRVPFGPQTARSIDRYLRLRRAHKLADTSTLWLGDRGRGFGYPALRQALAERAQAAGVEGFHPHKLRHTLADRWLSAGGSEGGLMAVAGWSNSAMLRRYAQAQAEQRGADEARRLGLGDL